jgi:hypothetical protein
MDRNQQGRAAAFTVLTPIRRGVGRPWLSVVLGIARRTGKGTKTLLDLELLHAARFAFVDDLEGERLPNRYLLFESNFNGSWDRYIDTFSSILGTGMWALWGACPGFPGPRPLGPFKRYIRDNGLDVAHYYVAYPEASARTILGALELRAAFAPLPARAQELDAEAFAVEWEAFLTGQQRHV